MKEVNTNKKSGLKIKNKKRFFTFITVLLLIIIVCIIAICNRKIKIDESTDICNDDDGVTIDDVSKMVSLGNAEVLEVKQQHGTVTKLKIKSNNYEFELQSDGNFKVNGE